MGETGGETALKRGSQTGFRGNGVQERGLVACGLLWCVGLGWRGGSNALAVLEYVLTRMTDRLSSQT